MTHVELACMIVDKGDYEHQLQIGHQDIRRRPEKRTGSGIGGGDEAGTFVPPFEHRACDLCSPSERRANRFSVAGHAPRLNIVDVILQILSDPREFIHDRNAKLFQFFASTNAGKLQNLR